jgi:predicted DNA-binding transcriptional regulator AlpA
MDIIVLAGELYERADALKARLGVGDMTLWRLGSGGMPKPLRIGRWRFYPRAEVDAWFLQRTAK